MASYTRTINAGPNAAPSAPKPGMGAGNVPFAPGVMSGNLGQQTNPTPLARQSGQYVPSSPQQMAPDQAPKGQVPPPGPQQPPMGMAQPSLPWPEIMLKVYDAYMRAIIDSANKPIGGMY